MNESMRAQLVHQEYLGDGVYAGYDGFQIVLFLQDTGAYGFNAIALESQVLTSLIEYAERIEERRAEETTQDKLRADEIVEMHQPEGEEA